MLTDGTNKVIATMKDKGCKRLVVVTVSDETKGQGKRCKFKHMFQIPHHSFDSVQPPSLLEPVIQRIRPL